MTNEKEYKYLSLPATEEEGIRFFQSFDIMPSSKLCAKQHEMTLSFAPRPRWRCHHQDCRTSIGVRNATWLQGSKLSFCVIIKFMYAWIFQFSTFEFCFREFGMCKEAFTDWNSYMQEVAAYDILNNSKEIKIGGIGHIVEIDEAFLPGRKYNSGLYFHEMWLLGGMCRETKKVFVCKLEKRDPASLLQLIKKYVVPGSTVYTERSKSYSTALLEEAGYVHLTVDHEQNLVVPEDGVHTRNIEGLWGKSKAKRKREGGIPRSKVDMYVFEYLWRENLGDKDGFTEIMKCIVDFNRTMNT